MIARLLISQSLDKRVEEIDKLLSEQGFKRNHPDLFYLDSLQKLGIAEARKIKEHFSLKPYQSKGRAVVLEDASNLTIEAQNALLKTLEEPPAKALLILGAQSDAKFLPTILSRCQITHLSSLRDHEVAKQSLNEFNTDIEKLLESSIEERFEYIEKLKDREKFLKSMVHYFHQNLRSHLEGGRTNSDFLKELLQAEEWAEANVNIRAILEYLILKMPVI